MTPQTLYASLPEPIQKVIKAMIAFWLSLTLLVTVIGVILGVYIGHTATPITPIPPISGCHMVSYTEQTVEQDPTHQYRTYILYCPTN